MMLDHFFKDPSFWILVSFILFLIIVLKKAAHSLLGFLKHKKQTISRQMAEAQSLLEEAEQLVRYEEKKIAQLKAKIIDDEKQADFMIAQHESDLKVQLENQKNLYKAQLLSAQSELEDDLVYRVRHAFMQQVLQDVMATFRGKKGKPYAAAFLEAQIQRID